ncbi:hypothetical protein ACRAWF_33735 [Streptomyces sp. L7]
MLALASPFASKLGEVQHDRVTDYLPASADSTQVAKIQEQLPGGQTTELVLVYHRAGGLTAADRTTAAQQLARISTLHPLAATPPRRPVRRAAPPSCTRSPATGPAPTRRSAPPSSTTSAKSPRTRAG